MTREMRSVLLDLVALGSKSSDLGISRALLICLSLDDGLGIASGFKKPLKFRSSLLEGFLGRADAIGAES